MKMKKNESFEISMKRLEEILDLLDSGEAELSKSMELFSEGVKISDHCNSLLAEAEQKIALISKKQDDPENSYSEEEYSFEK